MGEVLGVRFEAIEFLFKLYGIDDLHEQRVLFEKIKTIDMARLSKKRNATNNKK